MRSCTSCTMLQNLKSMNQKKQLTERYPTWPMLRPRGVKVRNSAAVRAHVALRQQSVGAPTAEVMRSFRSSPNFDVGNAAAPCRRIRNTAPIVAVTMSFVSISALSHTHSFTQFAPSRPP
eukprot:m.443855 g.443855  ORF g.443855 m.443855 type:complete len:120 (+) comp19019_c0_seq1:1361-1720(+)